MQGFQPNDAWYLPESLSPALCVSWGAVVRVQNRSESWRVALRSRVLSVFDRQSVRTAVSVRTPVGSRVVLRSLIHAEVQTSIPRTASTSNPLLCLKGS